MSKLSYSALVDRKLVKARQPIEFVKTTAEALLEDAYIKLEKQTLDPLGNTDLALDRAVSPLDFEAIRLIRNADSYMNLTTPEVVTEIRRHIGYSPGIIEDIAKKIISPLTGIIEGVESTIEAAITAAVSLIKQANLFIESRIGGVVNAAKAVVKATITASQGVVTGAIAGVKAAVDGILDGVADIATQLMAALAACFKTLTDKLGNLLTFETQDIFDLQKDLSKLGEDAMKDAIKIKRGGG